MELHSGDRRVPRDHASSWKHPRARIIWFNPIKKYAYPIMGEMLLEDIKASRQSTRPT
jgi:hypothetical protein